MTKRMCDNHPSQLRDVNNHVQACVYVCVCICMLKESDKDRALLKRETALATLPLCRLQTSRITPQHQSRDQSCWEPEEMGGVGLGSVSRYSSLLCHSAPLFFVLSFTLLGLVALPHLVSKYQSLCPATHPSLHILSSFLVALFMISSLCFICPSSPCFSLLLPLSLSLSAGGSASVIEGSFSFHCVGDKF